MALPLAERSSSPAATARMAAAARGLLSIADRARCIRAAMAGESPSLSGNIFRINPPPCGLLPGRRRPKDQGCFLREAACRQKHFSLTCVNWSRILRAHPSRRRAVDRRRAGLTTATPAPTAAPAPISSKKAAIIRRAGGIRPRTQRLGRAGVVVVDQSPTSSSDRTTCAACPTPISPRARRSRPSCSGRPPRRWVSSRRPRPDRYFGIINMYPGKVYLVGGGVPPGRPSPGRSASLIAARRG